MGGVIKVERADKECKSLDLDLDEILAKCPHEKIAKMKRTGKKGTHEVIFLKDASWAGAWAMYYGVNPPHHRQKKLLSKK